MIFMIHQNLILPSLKLLWKEIIRGRINGRNISGTKVFEFKESAIQHKLPESIFENYEIMKISKFPKITKVIYPKNLPNQTCGYWLITPNQKTLCIETNMFLTAGNYKSSTGQLKNNSVNGAMLITINHVINNVILKKNFLKIKKPLLLKLANLIENIQKLNTLSQNIFRKKQFIIVNFFICFDYGGIIKISQCSCPEITRYQQKLFYRFHT